MTTQIIPKKQEEKTENSNATTNTPATTTHSERNSSFDSLAFRKVWQAFFSKSTSGFAKMLMDAKITVKNCPTVALEMPKNMALQSEFERVKVELMPYLANELANDKITFQVTYIETQVPQAAKTLTDQEKLNLLIQNYPLLGDAMQRFGLSLE